MKKYIAVKIVNAEPMSAMLATRTLGRDVDTTNSAPNENGETGYRGYLVEYEDGYRSWCPEKQFEEANRPCDGMTFGLAQEAALKGHGFKLPAWQDDVVIRVQIPDEGSKMTEPYFYVTSRFGMVPWIPTMIEMFSNAWVIVREGGN